MQNPGADKTVGQLQHITGADSISHFAPCDTGTVFQPGGIYWLRFKPSELPPAQVIGLPENHDTDLRLFSASDPSTKSRFTETSTSRGDHFSLFPHLLLPEQKNRTEFNYLAVTVAQPLSAQALRIFSEAAFEKFTWQTVLTLGLAFGAIGAAALYALLCWSVQRQTQQLLFMIFLFALLCYHLAGSGVLRLIAPQHASIFAPPATIFGYVVLICSAVFSRSFLKTQRHSPRVDLLIRLCPFSLMAGLACMLLGAPRTALFIGYATAFLLMGLFAAAAMVASCNKQPAVRFYMAAWTIFLAGMLAGFFNTLFAFSHNFLFGQVQLFAGALAAVPLSFALAANELAQLDPRRRTEGSQQPLDLTDELTGLYNKRFFNSSLESAIEYSKLTGSPLSLLMLNVDNYRRFNETFGSPQADKVLSTLGELIRNGVRNHDVPCRFDNEQFAIILPGATETDARHAAERFRKAFANFFFHPDPTIRVNSTLSVGVATYLSDDTASSVFERAGQALHRAKADGSEKIMFAKQN